MRWILHEKEKPRGVKKAQDKSLCIILVTQNGAIDSIYYENKRIEEEGESEWSIQVNSIRSRAEVCEEMKKVLDQEHLAAPLMSCEGNRGAATKTGNEQEQLLARQTIVAAVLGINLSEEAIKACGLNTDKLKEVVKVEFEKNVAIRDEGQIVLMINEWRKHMQLQIKGDNNITRRFLAIRWLVCIAQEGGTSRHTLNTYGITNDPEDGESVYVLKIKDQNETKIVPLIQMPCGMRWKNITNSND